MSDSQKPPFPAASSSAGPATPITVVALDGFIDVARVATRLRWPELRRYPYGSVYDVDNGGRLYVFGFGAIAHYGAERLDEAMVKVIEDACERKTEVATAETYHITVDPEHAGGSPRVGWDRVVVPSQSNELFGAIAMLMGQSAALERYERAADNLVDEALILSRRIAAEGKPTRATSTQLKRVGRITSVRLELSQLFYLLDRPEETWEYPQVAALYDALFQNLELRDRHKAMLDKLEAVEHVTDVVINLWQGRVSNRLEWTIVLLIVAELVITFVEKL